MGVREWWDKLMGKKDDDTTPSPVPTNKAPGPGEPIMEPPEAGEARGEMLERERKRAEADEPPANPEPDDFPP